MSGAYSFLPWARQGLGNQISATGPLRGSAPIQLEAQITGLDGTTTRVPVPTRDLQLYGPGDIVGIDARAIIRTEPRDWITNFEPNYLAAIEFYDEDFPWRYTPVAPDASGRRLAPWIALVVLKQGDEFDEGTNIADRPLPYITLKNNARQVAFPDPATAWAWAHVHVNRGLTSGASEVVAADRDAVASRLATTLNENADLAYSRIVCPRKLQANATYCAFLVPAFESGRLAGLGRDPALAPGATASSWAGNGADADSFPVYFRWQFRTGAVGDFEYLVRLLQPRPADKRVGTRDMDVQRPGMIQGIADPDQHGALPLGGALRVPRGSFTEEQRAEVERRENWAQPYPHRFQRDLAALINLADAYTHQPVSQANAATAIANVAGDPDPVIVPPLYARWHAQTPRLLSQVNGDALPEAANWVHEINLDPLYRVPAGFGTQVVQARQEDLMAAAWAQVGDVLEANKRIRRFRFAQQVAFAWHEKQLAPLVAREPGKALMLTAPVHARVMASSGGSALTLKAQVAASAVTPALVAPTMRRLTRPRARLMRALPFDSRTRAGNLLARVNDGAVRTAPPKTRPAGAISVDGLVRSLVATGVGSDPSQPPPVEHERTFVALALFTLIALILWLAGAGLGAALGVFALGIVISMAMLAIRRPSRDVEALREIGQTPASVDKLRASPDFAFTEPAAATAAATLTRTGSDNAESARFKSAMKDMFALTEASVAADTVGENGPARMPLQLADAAAIMVSALDPAVTLPRRAASLVRLPERLRDEQVVSFSEVMAYPVFDVPMYKPLAELSAELLIPNVNLIENNTITLLETHQKFIEAYMVGLNHELARELLWREYPTDQRGSSFRQFWDVSGYFPGAGADAQSLREQLRDIPPLHKWPRDSRLGSHDARERPGDNEEELVLVIRGELLKRYPNAVIYAQKAEWALVNGAIDPSRERSLVKLAPSEADDPPRTKLRTPLYMGKVEPDLCFIGFDLTFAEALGGDGTGANDEPGWFFVIKERPGEPRFGFDESGAGPVTVWNDLAWDRVPMSGENLSPVPAPGIQIPAGTPPGEEEKEDQRKEDAHVRWDDDISAAELAYIMFQAPAMVAVHAAEMLPKR